MANFYDIMRNPSAVVYTPPVQRKWHPTPLPPTPGYNKLGPAARAAAASRAKAFEV